MADDHSSVSGTVVVFTLQLEGLDRSMGTETVTGLQICKNHSFSREIGAMTLDEHNFNRERMNYAGLVA
jgi:hypothetical protein